MVTFIHIDRCSHVKHSALTRWQGWQNANCLHWRALTRQATRRLRELQHVFHALPIGLLLLTSGYAHSADSPAIALASSLRAVWPSLMESYTSQNGAIKPRTSFASSGLLTTQIRHGAPFELFLSADQKSVKMLEKLGKTRDAGVTFAYGGLSLLIPRPLAPQGDLSLATLQALLSVASAKSNRESASNRVGKIAIPNPIHAPYGIAAQQVLMNADLWPLAAGQLLAAENAAQTLQFILSGAVDAAIVPSTLLTVQRPTLLASELPPDTYDPVIHRMVLTSSAGDGAEHLYKWLQSDAAREIFSRFGLSAPAR